MEDGEANHDVDRVAKLSFCIYIFFLFLLHILKGFTVIFIFFSFLRRFLIYWHNSTPRAPIILKLGLSYVPPFLNIKIVHLVRRKKLK